MATGPWNVVVAPVAAVDLTRVRKEPGCQGGVFLIWRRGDAGCVWCGQSLPALVRHLNELGVGRFHVSSFYRVARGRGGVQESSTQRQHLGWTAERWARSQLSDLKARLREFERVAFLTRDPDRWEIAMPEAPTAGEPQPERAEPPPARPDDSSPE